MSQSPFCLALILLAIVVVSAGKEKDQDELEKLTAKLNELKAERIDQFNKLQSIKSIGLEDNQFVGGDLGDMAWKLEDKLKEVEAEIKAIQELLKERTAKEGITVPHVQTATTSTVHAASAASTSQTEEKKVEGSTSSSKTIERKLNELTTELQDLQKVSSRNFNPDTVEGKNLKEEWTNYFVKYLQKKREIVELQKKVATEKEYIDLETEIKKLNRQIEQAEPVSDELKEKIRQLQDLQEEYEKYDWNAYGTPQLKEITKNFTEMNYRVGKLLSKAGYVPGESDSKVEKARKEKSAEFKSLCGGDADKKKCFVAKVEIMKLYVRIAKEKMEIVANQKATTSTDQAVLAPTTSKTASTDDTHVVLAPGTSQGKGKGIKRKKKVPAKRLK